MSSRLVRPPAYIVIDLGEGVEGSLYHNHAHTAVELHGTQYALRQLLLDALAQLDAE